MTYITHAIELIFKAHKKTIKIYFFPIYKNDK